MRLDRYMAKSRMVDIVSQDFEGALKQLLAVCRFPVDPAFNKELLLKDLMRREENITTYLGKGIALPHIRIPMKKKYIFIIGRCPHGLYYEGHEEYRQIRLVFLLLAGDDEPNYLNMLASLARTFQDQSVIDRLTKSPSIEVLQAEITRIFSQSCDAVKTKENKFNRLILREALKVAKGTKSNAIMVFADTFLGSVDLREEFAGFKTILVTKPGTEASSDKTVNRFVVPVHSFSNNRMSQLRSAMLISMTRGILKANERICCVGGVARSNQLDFLVVLDIEREFQSVFTRQTDMLPSGVKPEVLERVLSIATELSVEGREGKPVGCLFVVGNFDAIKPHTKQLVLNPFFGYQESDRNILNPFMDETVKEFSSLDGAFIIRGNGVLESAGTLIHSADYRVELPSGLGSRHVAGAAISVATDSISIVVSSSTGQVTLFRRGQMLPVIERGFHRNL